MRRPRVGFLGVGWIGRDRMRAMVETGVIEAVAVADPLAESVEGAVALTPGAVLVDGLNGLLDLDLDGVVIATPSALHAGQSITALQRGVAVFCQKPLGRNAEEAKAVVDAARGADRLLGVDFSYRHAEAVVAVRDLVRSGELGDIHAIDLVFHNAYGPDKPWFYDRALSGGGCVMDLGVHLVDLALWVLDFPALADMSSRLLSGGTPLKAGQVEDYAAALMRFETGTVAQLACSWRLQAGREAVISASFYGSRSGAAMRNVGGSFYDFTAERFDGTRTEALILPPDAWGGRAAAAWARRLAESPRFDASADALVSVAKVIDRIYAGCRDSVRGCGKITWRAVAATPPPVHNGQPGLTPGCDGDQG